MSNWGRSDQLHVGLLTILDFMKTKGKLPSMEDSDECWKIAQDLIKNKSV